MMKLTLEEDKEIIEAIYPEYQKGFMNARFDKQVIAAPDIHKYNKRGEKRWR